jgi:hypothetical protein
MREHRFGAINAGGFLSGPFDSKLVLWAYECMQTTLWIADEPMRHEGHCP